MPPVLQRLARRLILLLRLLGPVVLLGAVLLATKDYLVAELGLFLFQILLVPAILGAMWLGVALRG